MTRFKLVSNVMDAVNAKNPALVSGQDEVLLNLDHNKLYHTGQVAVYPSRTADQVVQLIMGSFPSRSAYLEVAA